MEFETTDDIIAGLRSTDGQTVRDALGFLNTRALVRQEHADKREEIVAELYNIAGVNKEGLGERAILMATHFVLFDELAKDHEIALLHGALDMLGRNSKVSGIQSEAVQGLELLMTNKPKFAVKAYDSLFDLSSNAKSPFTRYAAQGYIKNAGCQWMGRRVVYNGAAVAKRVLGL